MARLLVVDDEPSLCQMLEIAFRKDGHTVETVSSGQAALKKIDTHAHDLIISDIRMPDLSGIDLLKHARACVVSCCASSRTTTSWGAARRFRPFWRWCAPSRPPPAPS